MKSHRSLTLLLLASAALPALAHEPVTRARTEIKLPDVPGFVTMRCDFHIHTIFSDGLVWPTVRVEEAWREGLDAIAITDHLEYQPHKLDVSTNHNRSVEIARGTGRDLGILVVKGSEITRKMPPGHLNAIFLTNSSPLAVPEWTNAVAEAHEQGAFIFWNHPGWEAQTTNGLVIWYPEHTRLLEQGMLNGIEVVNGRAYYPEAHRWAIEKKLTLLSNSDIHSPIQQDYHLHEGDHRPVTLVFARDATPTALKEALFDRQTAVYTANRLIGDERFLRPIFDGSVRVKPGLVIKGRQRALAQVSNDADLEYELQLDATPGLVSTPKTLILSPRQTVLLELRARSTNTVGRQTIHLPCRVQNLLIGPDQPLSAALRFEVEFNPAP